jgi:hypothetical protein
MRTRIRDVRQSQGGCGMRTIFIAGAGLALLVACVCIVLFLLSPSGEEPAAPEPPAASQPVASPQPTATPRPTRPAAASSGDQTWLVMLYMDADDEILEQDIFVDLNEAERVGSSDRVHIVAQVDRYRGGFSGGGNWTSTKRFYVTRGGDLDRIESEEVADLGEVSMSDGQTLVDFVTWAVKTYPADKHLLILSDHGAGWPGGWSDPDPGGQGRHDIALAEFGDNIFLMELDEALGQIRAQTGLDKLEVIGMDACLMGHIEVLSALAPHARYAVASQETEPSLGWAYTAFLGALQANPGMDGAGLAQAIVGTYIEQDQRIVDDEAREQFVHDMTPLGPFYSLLFGQESPEQLAQDMGKDVTLTAVDLAAVPKLIASLNELAFALSKVDQRTVAKTRTYAQSFTSVFGEEVPPSYIDLGHMAQLIRQEVNNSEVRQAAERVLAAIGQAIVAEKHGPEKPGASGVSIYFPNSALYREPTAGPESYTTVANRFALESLWDDFLAFHYTGQRFDMGSVQQPPSPEPAATVVAPGAGKITLTPLTLSANRARPGRPLTMKTEISGQNIGFVYLFVGYYDEEANSIMVADQDFIEGEGTREIGGVYYPDWGDDPLVPIEFDWEPVLFAISDGVNTELAMLKPEDYGRTGEEASYTVQGIYTSAQSGKSRYALLYFQDGLLQQVYGFTGQGGEGAPREINPRPGDTFTILEKWIDLNASGEVVEYSIQQGGTLIFGQAGFTWEEVDAPAGAYVIGFIVEDLDGNAYETYETVTVTD